GRRRRRAGHRRGRARRRHPGLHATPAVARRAAWRPRPAPRPRAAHARTRRRAPRQAPRRGDARRPRSAGRDARRRASPAGRVPGAVRAGRAPPAGRARRALLAPNARERRMRWVRTWLPLAIIAGGVIAAAATGFSDTGLEGGALLVSAGLSVWLLNLLYRVGV